LIQQAHPGKRRESIGNALSFRQVVDAREDVVVLADIHEPEAVEPGLFLNWNW
jgi:hypothetical protein